VGKRYIGHIRQYLERLLDPLLAQVLRDHPAVMIGGPRARGKTTTAARHAATLARLDRPAEARVFEADPDAALRSLKEPVLLDEWQEVPQVLGAVKRQVDRDSSPGRYLLTGFVRADLDAQTWPGTGRVIRLDMRPLAVSERLAQRISTLVDRVAEGRALAPAEQTLDLRDYAALALAGGFPEPALHLSIAIEVKASAAPERCDARHLEWLRDGLGERFIGGVVLHTGPAAYPLAERIQAAPISCLWGQFRCDMRLSLLREVLWDEP